MLSLSFVLLIAVSLASSSRIQPKISDSNEAVITEFPFLVSIQEINVHVCAGKLSFEREKLSLNATLIQEVY